MSRTPRIGRRLRRPAAIVIAYAMAATSLVGLSTIGAPAATAADLANFDPGYIISDSIFYDTATMSAGQVQAFLAAKGANCVPGSGRTCLKDYTYQPTGAPQARVADSYCAAYNPAVGDTAGQIISKVSAACRINPQVIIVTLQKEQGLVTASAGGTTSAYQIAMGYGCPDSAACDTTYYGFSNQVYSAARQFQRYAAGVAGYYKPGRPNTILYSPNTACGSSQVVIGDQATASLYDYTPYQPNAAALAAGYGTGDACSSYGNRNFWNYFTDWFGSTTQRPPFGSLDVVAAGGGTLTVAGWALDPDTTAPIAINLYVDGALVGGVAANGSRPDVGAVYHKGDAHGFNMTVGAASGLHSACVYAIDSAGGPNPLIGCKTVTVVNHLPIGSLDYITINQDLLTVGGWALDPDTQLPIAVHVYIDGRIATATTANGDRPDVAAVFGDGAAHGFAVTAPGRLTVGVHRVCLFAIEATIGPNPTIACKTVTVKNMVPIGALDAVVPGPGQIWVAGWALDPDTTSPIAVHFYVDGTIVSGVAANGSRPDVGAALGMGDNHGFSATLPVPVGTHTVCVYAIDSSGGPNPLIRCAASTVTAAASGGA